MRRTRRGVSLVVPLAGAGAGARIGARLGARSAQGARKGKPRFTTGPPCGAENLGLFGCLATSKPHTAPLSFD